MRGNEADLLPFSAPLFRSLSLSLSLLATFTLRGAPAPAPRARTRGAALFHKTLRFPSSLLAGAGRSAQLGWEWDYLTADMMLERWMYCMYTLNNTCMQSS